MKPLAPPPDPKQATEFSSQQWQSWMYLVWQASSNLPSYTVAQLPTAATSTITQGVQPGAIAYANNGRKVGEGVGAGTGVPVYFSNGQWRVYSTDAVVVA